MEIVNNIPKHVALIMDGNGRWAKLRGLARTFGHKKGAERIIDIVKSAKEIGIKVVTVYAFSTENWKRSKDEVDYIFNLLEDTLSKRKEKIMENNVRIRHSGTLDRLVGEYDSLKKAIEEIVLLSKDNDGITLNVCFNYGGRDEIVRASKNISKDVLENKISLEQINEDLFSSYLMTAGLEDVDLVVRTSGEQRLSNFLLWQVAYSELMFIDTYWPDFDGDVLKECVAKYQKRDRKFGNVK